jgi:hypothetical protein
LSTIQSGGDDSNQQLSVAGYVVNLNIGACLESKTSKLKMIQV